MFVTKCFQFSLMFVGKAREGNNWTVTHLCKFWSYSQILDCQEKSPIFTATSLARKKGFVTLTGVNARKPFFSSLFLLWPSLSSLVWYLWVRPGALIGPVPKFWRNSSVANTASGPTLWNTLLCHNLRVGNKQIAWKKTSTLAFCCNVIDEEKKFYIVVTSMSCSLTSSIK